MAKVGSHARQRWPVAVLTMCILAGGLFAAAAVTSDGSDLRPAGGDVASLLQERALRVERSRAEARELQQDIDDLAKSTPGGSLDDAARPASPGCRRSVASRRRAGPASG